MTGIRPPASAGGQPSGAPTRSASLPTAEQVIGAFMTSFGATRDASEPLHEVMCSRTWRRGRNGACENTHWCCYLRVLIFYLFQRGLFDLPSGTVEREEARDEFRQLCLVAHLHLLAWRVLRKEQPTGSSRAHLRFGTMLAASAIGALWGDDLQLDSVILCRDPAWADPQRAAEPLHTYREQLGMSQRRFADRIGFDKDAVNRWFRGRQVPPPNAMECIADLAEPEALDVLLTWRHLRWHFGLHQLAKHGAQTLGWECIRNLADSFVLLVHSAAQHAVGLTFGERFVLSMRLLTVVPVRCLVCRAEHTGLSADFVADIESVAPVWKAVFSELDPNELPELALVMKHLARTEGPLVKLCGNVPSAG